jgi:hypothetical protein
VFDGYGNPAPTATRNTSAVRAADFGFRYESKDCPYEIIDAFKNTYRTYRMAAPIPMRLTDAERAAIAQVVAATRFFELPRTMDQPDSSALPASAFELAVYDGVGYHQVLWRISSGWTLTDEGGRAVKVLRTIYDVVHARPDVAQVQPRGDGCGGPEH